MRVDAFDFHLPEDRIALRPVVPRDAAKLLLVNPDGLLADKHIRDLPELLQPGDVLVANDTKVIPARLWGLRDRVKVECLLHQRLSGNQWRAFARPGKRLKIGSIIKFDDSLDAKVIGKLEDGQVTLDFNKSAADLDVAIAQQGEMPLPPYIAGKRAADAQDALDYQTLFAQQPGAVAAPTAGLHFTDDLLRRLEDNSIQRVTLTLHVGAGTFLPVKADNTQDHKMHAEWGQITADVADQLNRVRASGGRIVAVGTTSLRLLESAADEAGTIHPFAGETDIFITPGYQFRAVDVLLTNFHLPKSTLFMLVSAFSGLDVMQRAYAHAIDNGYRFYSYGDACLLIR